MKKIWRLFKNMSLKWKWLIVIMLVMLPMTVIFLLILNQFDSILIKQSYEEKQRMLDKMEANLSEVIQTVEDISTYMIYSNDSRTFMKLPNNEDNRQGLFLASDQINAFTIFQLMSRKYINSVSLLSDHGNELNLGEPILADEEKWVEKAIQAKGKIIWTEPYLIEGSWEGPKEVITLLRVINDITDMNRSIGLIKIRLDVNEFYNFIHSGSSSQQEEIFVVDEDGKVLMGDQTGLNQPSNVSLSLIEKALAEEKDIYHSEQKKTRQTVLSRKLSRTNWHIMSIIKDEEIVKGLKEIRFQFLFTVMFSIALALLGLMVLFYSIIRPIIELTKGTVKVEKGDFTTHVPVRSTDEIGNLGESFNFMVAKINNLINTKYKLTIKQRESELNMLLNQLDPHFLYNTLDTIRWTARLENANETSHLIEALSHHFRISLQKSNIWINLEDEFKVVKSYLDIQKSRMGNLTYALYADSRVVTAIVLNKIIQPLVENSIVHGFKDRQHNERNNIQVRCYIQAENLFIDVLDNGSGFDVSKMKKKLNQTGLQKNHALYNIHERLINAFGNKYGVKFIESTASISHIRLTLPLLWSEDEVEKAMIERENEDGD